MASEIPAVTTRALHALLQNGDAQLIDCRPIDAYNGWQLQGEPRGGHIPGARSLPHKWTAYLDWIEIVRAKGIRVNRPVIVYGYAPEEALEVAGLFGSAGYGDVRVYHDFVADWASDPELPLEVLPRHRHLVPAEWVHQLVSGREPEEFDGGPFVLCHAHYRNPDDYAEGHIAGAVALDTLLLEAPETWNRRSPAEVEAALLGLGITADTTVVLYGRDSHAEASDPFPGSSAGQLAAFRCAFIMLWAGVKDVRVLNGGLQSWLDAGYAVITEPSSPAPVTEFGVDIPARPELAVDLPEAREILASPDANLVSVRSWPEYIGEVSGYNYIERKGRIPGSVFGNCGSDAYHMENYRNLDHTTREYGEILASLRSAGVLPEARNAFYCGTGWRGSEAFFNAWLLGWPRVAVYDGGWFEWSSDPSNPTETGVPGGSAA